MLPLSVAALAGCGSGNTTNSATPKVAATGPTGPTGPTGRIGPTGTQGRTAAKTKRHASQPGSGSGPIIRSTKAAQSGAIVIRGRAGTHTYGPFSRKTTSYAVTARQPTAGQLGIAVEPMSVSSTEKTMLQLTGTTGQAVSSIPWTTFYVWIPRAPSSYVVTFTPHG